MILSGPIFSQFANGQIIMFDNLTGSNSDPFTLVVENGFTVTSTVGMWREGHLSGNPNPSIFSSTDIAQIEIAGPLFNWLSFQTNDGRITSGTSSATYEVEGFLNDVSVLIHTAFVSPQYETNFSPDTSQSLDRLLVTFSRGETSTYNIDNIELRIIPEPSRALLCLLGLGAVLARRRR